MGAVVDDAGHERLGLDALANETSLHVGDGDDEGVDLAAPHLPLELLELRVPAVLPVLVARIVGIVLGHLDLAPYFAVIAPSATMTEPVTKDDSSEARNSATLAISRGSPGRPIGWNESMVAYTSDRPPSISAWA